MGACAVRFLRLGVIFGVLLNLFAQQGCEKMEQRSFSNDMSRATMLMIAPGGTETGNGMSAADFVKINPDLMVSSRPFSLPSGVMNFDELDGVVLLDGAGGGIVEIKKNVDPIHVTAIFDKEYQAEEAFLVYASVGTIWGGRKKARGAF